MNRSAAGLLGMACALAVSAPMRAGATEGAPPVVGTIALPEPAACTLRAKRWWPEVRLELAPGIPYVAVSGAEAIEARLPVAAAPAPVGVTLKRGGFTLEGLVAADAVALHPRRAFVVADVLATTPLSALRWTDAGAAEIGLELALPDDTARALQGWSPALRVRGRCADLDLDPRSFDAFKAIGAKGPGAEARFAVPRAPLATKPGGPTVATLVASDDVSEALRVVDRKPGWARITVTLNEAVIFGWVPAASVRRPQKQEMIGEAYGVGGLGLSGVGQSKLKGAVSCNHDVRLVAEAGGQRRFVGKVGAGTAMQLLTEGDAYVIVRFDGLDPVKGAQFLVERAALTGCAN